MRGKRSNNRVSLAIHASDHTLSLLKPDSSFYPPLWEHFSIQLALLPSLALWLYHTCSLYHICSKMFIRFLPGPTYAPPSQTAAYPPRLAAFRMACSLLFLDFFFEIYLHQFPNRILLLLIRANVQNIGTTFSIPWRISPITFPSPPLPREPVLKDSTLGLVWSQNWSF